MRMILSQPAYAPLLACMQNIFSPVFPGEKICASALAFPCMTLLQPSVKQSSAWLLQEGMVLWDGKGSSDCRIGLTLPQEHAEEVR